MQGLTYQYVPAQPAGAVAGVTPSQVILVSGGMQAWNVSVPLPRHYTIIAVRGVCGGRLV